MKRTREIAFIVTLAFSMFMLAFCGMEAVAAGALGDKPVDAVRFANNAVMLFVYSLCIGLSFLIFDIKVMPQSVKRGIHLVLNYGLMLLFIFGFAEIIVADAAATAFVLSFVFILVYFGGMLLSGLFRKLDKALEEAKNSKK